MSEEKCFHGTYNDTYVNELRAYKLAALAEMHHYRAALEKIASIAIGTGLEFIAQDALRYNRQETPKPTEGHTGKCHTQCQCAVALWSSKVCSQCQGHGFVTGQDGRVQDCALCSCTGEVPIK